MLIEITAPIFKCKDDENIFFSRLQDLKNIASVTNKIKDKVLVLHVTLSPSSQGYNIEKLQEICDIWGTNFTVIT